MRVLRLFLAVFVLALPAVAVSDGDYYNHVLFDNSLTPDNDYYSEARAVYPSVLAGQDGRIPVETKQFFTPPNALRLEWQSMPGGSWDAEVQALSIRNRPVDFRGDTLYFWCYAPEGLATSDLPAIQLLDNDHDFTAPVQMASFTGTLPPRKWVQVRIPLRMFTSASIHSISLRHLHSIYFSQSAADGKPHTLIVDEIKIDDESAVQGETHASLPVPNSVHAQGYERHVDVSWDAPANDDVQYFVVYRATDGKRFNPVGIQVPGINRFTDYVGAEPLNATYKVAAVDKSYHQSEFSDTASASTHTMSDDDLLTMLQEECFRYYWEKGSHPHSGTTRENVPGDDRIVATGASGFGIMAIVVGVDRGFITRQQGIERLTRIVDFLEKAPRYHGAWSHFMDGDTGDTLPVFGMFDNGGDLVETASDGGTPCRAPVFQRGHRGRALSLYANLKVVGNGGVGLVSQITDRRCALLALVPAVDLVHQSPTHGLQRSNDRLSSGHRIADAWRPRGSLLHRLGRAVESSHSISRRMVRHRRRESLRERPHLRRHQTRRRRR